MRSSMNRSAAVILFLSSAFFLARLVSIGAADPDVGRYDESIYYYAAQRTADGERPYRDFMYVQPPGLLVLTASGIRAGLPLSWLRIIHALSAVFLGGIVFSIAARTPASGPHAPALAVLLLFSSPLFFAESRIVTQPLPATTLVAAGILVIMLGRRGYIPLAALAFAASSLFRLQGLVFVPIVLPLIAVTEGEKRKAIAASVRFVPWVAVLVGVCHGSFQLAWPRYYENNVTVHAVKHWLGLSRRYRMFDAATSHLTFQVGLLAAAVTLSRRYPQSRAFGALTLLAVFLTATVFKALFPYYFLMVLPFVAICAATLISDIASCYGRGITALLAAALVSAVQMPQCARIMTESRRRATDAAELIETIRRLPGRTVMTRDPTYAILGQKRPTSDYYSTDTYGAYVVGRINQWIDHSLEEADFIVLDAWLINQMDRANVERIVRSAKPLYFGTAEDRSAWQIKSSRATAGPS